MIVKEQTLQNLRTQLRGEFKLRLAELAADSVYKKLATEIPSTTASNSYGWLSDFPHMREWVGDRVIKDIKESAYQLVNRKFESTLGVNREDIEDDNLGMYGVTSRLRAEEVDRFLNTEIAALLAGGFKGLCYDGQPFFDDEHTIKENADGTGKDILLSNIVGTGKETNPGWYLLSLNGSLKPLILQNRTQPEMSDITDTKNDSVFMKDKFMFGIRWRGEFGYGLWQQAVGSRLELTAANYEAARLKIQTFKKDGNTPLGVIPTHLVVSPENEAAARKILEMQVLSGGESNPNFHTAELIVNNYLSAAAAV
ncbi:MAG: Mu-like prophage major head subunit gpT family protein [Treponema sp.]|nr:Mu-like prophage major head subunit gpT family protein [Treponema sp.]